MTGGAISITGEHPLIIRRRGPPIRPFNDFENWMHDVRKFSHTDVTAKGFRMTELISVVGMDYIVECYDKYELSRVIDRYSEKTGLVITKTFYHACISAMNRHRDYLNELKQ